MAARSAACAYATAGVDIAAEEIPQLRLRVGGQQVDAQVGGADGVGLLGDQLPSRLEPRRGPREREGDQQPEQGEHGAVDRADAVRQAVRVVRKPGCRCAARSR